MKKTTKYETRQEAFERQFGKTALFKDEPKVDDNKLNPSTNIIVNVFRFIVRFAITGDTYYKYKGNRDAFMLFSGLFMAAYSILGMIYIQTIEGYIELLGISGGYLTFLMLCVGLFFLIQLIKGTSYMNGEQMFTPSSFGSKIPEPIVVIGSTNKSYNPTGKSDFNEIEDFKGYVNSKMAWKTNSDKEKYMSELFGGK